MNARSSGRPITAALTVLSMFQFLGGCNGSPPRANGPVKADVAPPSTGLAATRLRCENLVDPLGLDVKAPRFSWQVISAQRGQRQTAYQVLAASDVATLQKDQGDLWDSGKVSSDQTSSIAYGGKALASNQAVAWKVRAWDKDGKPSSWSDPATFSIGLLDASKDWKAQWIGCDKLRQVELPIADFGDAKWICFGGDKPLNAPKAARVFMTSFDVPAGAKVESAEALVAGDDRVRFVINGHLLLICNGHKDVRAGDILPMTRVGGTNYLRAEVFNAEPGPTGLLAKVTVKLADGKTVTCVTDGNWRATDKPGANWHDREIAADAWPKVTVLGDYGMQPWGKLRGGALVLPAPTYLRTTFKLDKPVRRAVAYATALGIYDLHLNGKRIADDQFNPGWTDYVKRVYYRAYDVTSQVKQGDNSIGAVLADGWYSGYVGYGRQRDHYGHKARFAAQLHVEYADGTSAEVAATGPDWKASTGPTTIGDFLMGEEFDARKAIAGWDTAGFADAKWEKVDIGSEVTPVLQHHPGPPVVAFKELTAKTITEPQPGVFVLDLGQNLAGVVRLKVNGEPGQKVKLRFAERLNPDGTIYTVNLRSARATDVYTCCGCGTEIWQPRFTFHGFQYVEVTGLKAKPSLDTVTAVALSSDTPVTGNFECSEPMLNQLRSNIHWTQRMNFIDIPTDCPQRDERLGWTGDAQVYVRTATLNTDVQAFFTKWLVDLDDGQREDGQYPMVAPVKVANNDGGPAWADAGVICPSTIYYVYNDKQLLAAHYPNMVRFIEFCKGRSTPELLPPAKYHCFGDWLSIKADTPKDVIYEAYFAQSTHLVARAAEILGKADDAAKYNALFEQLKAAFNKAYVAPDGRIKGNTQACYVLAIAFDLLDAEKQKLAAKYLVEDIESRDNHVSTGFIGTKDLMLTLAKIGRNDVAYRLLHTETFPSWGFSIKHGATSIWERWDGWTPEKGFQDPGMNSFAHYSFGAVYQWIVENVGGIRATAPGYSQVTIAPQPGGKLTWANTRYDSPRGAIETRWKRDGGKLTLDVTIPANVAACVEIPAAKAADVTEGGKALDGAEGVRLCGSDHGCVRVNVGSGTYRFVAIEPAR